MNIMKINFSISIYFFTLLTFNFVNFSSCSWFEFPSSEVFILPFSYYNFSLPSPGVSFRPSILDKPDLPSWLHYTYSPALHSGFIYGAPPYGSSNIKIEVIATDNHTYNTSKRVFNVTINEKSMKPNEVHFKITNMNIDELIVEHRWEKMMDVLVQDLWSESAGDGAVTSLLPASYVGDSLPLLPNDKEGVYVSYGSHVQFSRAMFDLELEVKPLWQHRPCPKNFKKASYERFFRRKGFAIDWCSFSLHTNAVKTPTPKPIEHNAAIEALLQDPPYLLMKKNEVWTRSYVFDVIYTILIPLMVMLVLLGFLSLAMCCHRTNMDVQSSIFFDELFDYLPRVPTVQEIQMVHYAGVNKALEAVKSVRGGAGEGRDYSPHPSTGTTTTQIDTLPRSRTGSPSSTIPRGSATPSRRFEDYATLTRPDPPPYHRNGSAHPYQEEDYLDN